MPTNYILILLGLDEYQPTADLMIAITFSEVPSTTESVPASPFTLFASYAHLWEQILGKSV